jgi:hypothetical protein
VYVTPLHQGFASTRLRTPALRRVSTVYRRQWLLVVSQVRNVMAKLLRKQGRLFSFLCDLTLVIYSFRQ